jgi:hypothetical protein
MITQLHPEINDVAEAFRRAEIVSEASKSDMARSGRSLLSKAIEQITAPNWWNEQSEPWVTNRKRLNETKEQRAKFIKSFDRRKGKVPFEQLAKEFDCSIQKIRGWALPFIESGKLVRGTNEDGKVTLQKGMQ